MACNEAKTDNRYWVNTIKKKAGQGFNRREIHHMFVAMFMDSTKNILKVINLIAWLLLMVQCLVFSSRQKSIRTSKLSYDLMIEF